MKTICLILKRTCRDPGVELINTGTYLRALTPHTPVSFEKRTRSTDSWQAVALSLVLSSMHRLHVVYSRGDAGVFLFIVAKRSQAESSANFSGVSRCALVGLRPWKGISYILVILQGACEHDDRADLGVLL